MQRKNPNVNMNTTFQSSKLQTFVPENKSFTFKGTHAPQKLEFTDFKSTSIKMKLHQDSKPNKYSFPQHKNYLPDNKLFQMPADSSPLPNLARPKKFANIISPAYLPPESIFSISKNDIQKQRNTIKNSIELIKNVTTRVDDLKNKGVPPWERNTCGSLGALAQSGTSLSVNFLLNESGLGIIGKIASKEISKGSEIVGNSAQNGCQKTFEFVRNHTARENPESPFSTEMEDSYKKITP